MSTYQFQLSITPDNYQSQFPILEQHISPQAAHNAHVSPTPIETPGPVIIQYDGKEQKQPYGSGDDGFPLTFNDIDAFLAWKANEEATKCIEYYKVDSHTSKADPPRFKDHVKLACTRHARAGQKKYVRLHPERSRKVPSKKIEDGCPSIITYKTYHGSTIVKASYVSAHSHEIGEANLPFTKTYRRSTTVKRKASSIANMKERHSPGDTHEDDYTNTEHNEGVSESTSPSHSQYSHFQQHGTEASLPPSPPASMDDTMDMHSMETRQHVSYGDGRARMPAPPYAQHPSSQNTSPSMSHPHNQQHPQMSIPRQDQQPPPPQPAQPFTRSREASIISMHPMNRDIHDPQSSGHHVAQYHSYHRPADQRHQHSQPPQSQQPPQTQQHQAPQTYPHPHPHPQSQPQVYHGPISAPRHSLPTTPSSLPSHPQHTGPSPLPDRRTSTQERWTRLETIFGHVRRHANEFEFAEVSVSALEMLLLRLYLELPSNTQGPSPMHGSINQHPPSRDQNHGMLP